MNCKMIGLLLSGILCSAIHVSACLGPSNVEGVAFTNGEKLYFDSLRALGTNGVNYKLTLSDKGGTTVTYPSHYDSKVMAFIGNVGASYQQDILLNCFGIIYPLSEEMMSSHETVSKEVFNFAAAVKVELSWLAANKILTIEDVVIDSIFSSLNSATNGGMQYWTYQKKVLAYNSWYTYDTINLTWKSGDMEGVKSVNAVRGVNGCTGIQVPAFETYLPVAVEDKAYISPNRMNLSLSVSGKTITLNGLQANQSGNISIVSITGKVIKSFSMAKNSENRVVMNNLASGTYLIRCNISGVHFNRTVVLY